MNAIGSLRFHARNGIFSMRENFSDWASGIAGFLMFPFFLFILSRIWERFSSFQGNYTREELLAYLAVTESLFMTFFVGAGISRGASDFSLSLARPRSWLATQFSAAFGRCLGARLLYTIVSLLTLPLLGVPLELTLKVLGRMLILLPVLGVLQALTLMLLMSAKVFWEQTQYLVLPLSKIFLALGGVFSPLNDYGEPWRSWLLPLPPADWFFQPAYWCVRGTPYGLTFNEWILRIALSIALLLPLNGFFFRMARSRHQSYGG